VVVSIRPTGHYGGLIAGSFGHARIVYVGGGAALDLPDRGSLYLIIEIEECTLPRREVDDGQMHD
jgi:hypothetical protein